MVREWMRQVSKDFYQGEDKKGRHPPSSLRYMGGGLHAETGCRKDYVGEVFKIPLKRSRQLGMAVAGKMPTVSFLTKIGRALAVQHSARGPGESTDGLADENHGHINSAGCEGMATTVTSVHRSI